MLAAQSNARAQRNSAFKRYKKQAKESG